MNSLLSVLIINMVVCRYHRSICKLRSIERRSICTRTLYQFICIYIFRGLIKCENLHSRLYLIAFSLRFFFSVCQNASHWKPAKFNARKKTGPKSMRMMALKRSRKKAELERNNYHQCEWAYNSQFAICPLPYGCRECACGVEQRVYMYIYACMN